MTVTTPQATRGSARLAAAGILAAVAAATAIWALAWLLNVELTVSFDGEPIQVTVVNVILTALLASLLGWGVLVLLRRYTAKGLAIWTAIASVVALVSLVNPLMATAPAATKLTLVAMHLAVAIPLITTLRRTPRQ